MLFISGCMEMKIRELIEKANSQESSKDFIGAIETYNEIINLDEKDEIAHIKIGYLYMKLKEMDKAEESFRTAIAIDSNSSRALLGLSRLQFENRNYESALQTIDESLRMNPGNKSALIHKGNTLNNLLKHEEAIESFMKVIEINANEIEALTGIATGYLALEKNHLAELFIRKSMLIDSTDCISIRNFALFNYRINNQLVACEYSNRAYDICKGAKSRNLLNQIKEKVCH